MNQLLVKYVNSSLHCRNYKSRFDGRTLTFNANIKYSNTINRKFKMKRRLWNYGYSYAASINATKLYQNQTGDDISEFWKGYNEYIYETQELVALKKEIKDLKKAVSAAQLNKGEQR